MALDPKAEAALALHRFGFRPRAGSIAAIASDPRGALLAEINRPEAARISDPALMTSADAARAALKFQHRHSFELVRVGGKPTAGNESARRSPVHAIKCGPSPAAAALSR